MSKKEEENTTQKPEKPEKPEKKSSKYKSALIIFTVFDIFILIIFITALFLNRTNTLGDLSPIIPGKNIIFDLIYIFLILPIIFNIIFSLIFGYLISPLFAIFHYILMKKDYEYAIDKRPYSDTFKDTTRFFFPALFAINIALILAQTPSVIRIALYKSEWAHGINTGLYLSTFYSILPYAMIIGVIVYIPIFFITDAGIIYKNKDKDKNKHKPVEARTMGGYYSTLFKGYTGISAVISYYSFIMQIFIALYFYTNFVQFVMLSILLLCTPIFFMIQGIPAMIILDKIRPKRDAFIRKLVKKLGIKRFVRIELIDAEDTPSIDNNESGEKTEITE